MKKPNTEKSFEWLFTRFSQPNIKPCQFDIDCLKQIAETINKAKEDAIREDILFAKLFCRVFLQEVEHYKDFKTAQNSIGEILEKPIEWHYENVASELNRFALNDLYELLELNRPHFKEPTDLEKEKERAIFKENEKIITEYTKGKLTPENVFKSLNNTITEFIFKFKSKP